MSRNSRKIWPIETPAWTTPVSASRARTSFESVSLMALRCIPLEAVHHAGLRCTQRNPVLHILLQRNEELFAALLCLLVDVFPGIEFHLKREFTHEGLVLTACTPKGHVALPHLPFAEIQFAQFEQNLFDDGFTHEAHFFIGLSP